MVKLIFSADRESPSSSPESSDYHASDESDHSSPVSPTYGATAQRPSSVKHRAIKDLNDSSSTDDDKLSISDLLEPFNDDNSDIGTERPECTLGLQGCVKSFYEKCSEGSNDECLPPEIVLQKVVKYTPVIPKNYHVYPLII